MTARVVALVLAWVGCHVLEPRGGFSVQNETNCYICLDIDDYMVILFKQ